MTSESTLQLFADGAWHDAAAVMLLGAEQQGWQAATLMGYATEWALAHGGAQDAHALAYAYPVSLEARRLPHWPTFLLDLLPQGFGRMELLRQLGLAENAGPSADWRLLRGGAGNPVGHLRIKEAAAWLSERQAVRRGFSDEEVAARSGDFMEYLASQGLFVAGSSGVQGEWPKILLTRAQDGLLYLDHTLADDEGREYFIVKFGRGPDPGLACILRHEAPYMAIAAHLGLRVHRPLALHRQALFIPRFDRQIGPQGLQRIAQESLASLTGVAGFGAAPAHELACRKLAEVCSDPQAEILEYLRRDVANLAFGNKDNHARNTALQRGSDGTIALAPLFDFAPMYLHPDGTARRMRWQIGDGGAPDWSQVLDVVATECRLIRSALVEGLTALVPRLRQVAENSADFGLEPEVGRFLAPYIEAQARSLEQLS